MLSPWVRNPVNLPTIETIAAGVMKVSAFTGFEPFIFFQEDKLVGFDVDILQSFANPVGLSLELVLCLEFDGIWFKPAKGESDFGAAGIARF